MHALVELFKHIIHLDFQWLFSTYGGLIYLILFSIIFIETGLVFMPFLPGDSLLFTAGLFAQQGFLSIQVLLPLLFAAAILGDSTNYFIGRFLGNAIVNIQKGGKSLIKPEHLQKTHAFYEQYGTKTIIMARFVPIVRTFAPFVAGIASMRYQKFVSYDLLGGALWILSLTFAGYFLGSFEWIRTHIDLVALAIIFISVLPILVGILKNKTKPSAHS